MKLIICCAHRNYKSYQAVIRVYDAAGNVIETHKQTREFKER